MNSFILVDKFLSKLGFDLSHENIQKNGEITVAVAMSGGVDSSVVALILKRLGFNLFSIFMKNWEEENCSAHNDYQDVIKVCDLLEIPYYSLNFSKNYYDLVFKKFLEDYQSGFTPNPDILCNKYIKFDLLLEHAKLLGATFLATGHYARIKKSDNSFKLLKGLDANKDQSYFLSEMNPLSLSSVIFPLGELIKPQVRELAQLASLSTSHKKDSTGICFVGERKFKPFLNQYIQTQKGNFIDLHSNILGTHDGLCFYTLGQRKGLGIGGPGDAWFVAKKNLLTQEITLVQGEDHPLLYASELSIEKIHLMDQSLKLNLPITCKAKVRYRSQDVACEINPTHSGYKVSFTQPQRSLTPGQQIVFYDRDVLMGSAVIQAIGPSLYEQKTYDSFQASLA